LPFLPEYNLAENFLNITTSEKGKRKEKEYG